MKTGIKSNCKIHESPGMQRVQLQKKKLLSKIQNVNPLIIIIIKGS